MKRNTGIVLCTFEKPFQWYGGHFMVIRFTSPKHLWMITVILLVIATAAASAAAAALCTL